jgi:tRNA pseudouridine38-40 synthase
LRYFVEFSYFGAHYHGWQKQPNAITVQEVLEDAFSKILREEVSLMGAGRTDTGVHAKQMYAHFNFAEIDAIEQLIYRLNSLLPKDIAVKSIFKTTDDAHARFHATTRTYEYWLVQNKNPFYINHAHYIKHSLDIEKMNEAATIIMSFDDYECFSKVHTDVHTFLCDITYAKWEVKNDVLVFTITADRFLRNMVRAIVGTLLDVGLGKTDIEIVKAIIKSKDRAKAGVSVPAKGLYLTQVLYPENIVKINE